MSAEYGRIAVCLRDSLCQIVMFESEPVTEACRQMYVRNVFVHVIKMLPTYFLKISSDHENTYMPARIFWSSFLNHPIEYYWVANEHCSRNLQLLVKGGAL